MSMAGRHRKGDGCFGAAVLAFCTVVGAWVAVLVVIWKVAT